jgi:hypothetical protein
MGNKNQIEKGGKAKKLKRKRRVKRKKLTLKTIKEEPKIRFWHENC